VILTYLYVQNGGLTWTLKVTLLRLTFEIRLFFLVEYSKFGKLYRIRIEPEP